MAIAYDRASTFADAVKFIGSSLAGTPDISAAAGLLTAVVPFGKLLSHLPVRRLANAAEGAISETVNLAGGAGQYFSTMLRGLKASGGDAAKHSTRIVGDLAAISVAKQLGLRPLEMVGPRGIEGAFPTFYRGTDGWFVDEAGDIVVVEAKGFAVGSGGRGALGDGQMSQRWLRDQVKRLERYGFDVQAEEFARQIDEGRVKGLVVRAGVSGDEVVELSYEYKTWSKIGKQLWDGGS